MHLVALGPSVPTVLCPFYCQRLLSLTIRWQQTLLENGAIGGQEFGHG